MSNDNYPIGFSGVEGDEEETFLFGITGEVEIEDYNEESAKEQFLDMTIREALKRGLYLD